MKWTYSNKFITFVSIPILVVICSTVMALLIKLKNVARVYWERYKNRSLSPPTPIDSLYGIAFASFYYTYLQVVKKALEPLDCTTYDDGRRTMDADPSIACDVRDPVYARLRYWGIVCLVGYGVGIPLLFVFVLVVFRKKIKVDQVSVSG